MYIVAMNQPALPYIALSKTKPLTSIVIQATAKYRRNKKELK